MKKKRPVRFGAGPAALGYMFQCRYALYDSLVRLRKGTSFQVLMETLDDIVFEVQGLAPELLQTKHHLQRKADLSDTSPDLWKSIRVWSEGIQSETLVPDTTFYLVTTAAAKPGSAASLLRASNRDADRAVSKLSSTAATSVVKANKKGYAAFLSLSLDQRASLLSAVYLLDCSPAITDLEELLRQEVYWAVERKALSSFLQRLEGWWTRRAVEHLSKASSDPILSEEIETLMGEIREQFKQDNLPIDEDLFNEAIDETPFKDRTFVNQLKLVGVIPSRILIAIREFYRAFHQRSRWVREDLVLVGELGKYERKLVEEWQIVFEQMRQNLGVQAAEQEKEKAARKLYDWVESIASFPIRPRCTESFITRGSYHMLADDMRVGWHPEFLSRLRALLEIRDVRDESIR